jgi:glutamyl-tRNA reductase
MRSAVDAVSLAVAIGPPGIEAPTAAALRADPRVREAVVLTTCHRTELYGVWPSEPDAVAFLEPYVGRGFRPALGTSAAHHLIRVACGLDSPILGDGQVLGQVRRAYLTALEAGATGPWLNRAFEIALQAGKRVRHSTALGRGATNTAAAAVRVAERLSRGLEGKHVLIVGAGETATLAARHAAHRRPQRITIANRTPSHAQIVAAKVGGHAVGFDRLTASLHQADVVISATAAPDPVIHHATLQSMMALRPSRPLIAVDLAMPCDIEPAAAAVPGVTLVGLSDVEVSTAADRARRAGAVPHAEAIARDACRDFEAWCARRNAALPVQDISVA